MEALSTFDPSNYEKIDQALRSIRDAEAFLNADQAFSTNGLVVRFSWPDWPEDLSHQLKEKVDALHRMMAFLKPVAPDTEEWNSVFQGWRSDPESAKAIGEAFCSSFPGRVRWVFSRRDTRGRVTATCSVQALGQITLDLTWKGYFVGPSSSLSEADRAALSASMEQLWQWAGRRVKPVLDTLHDRLRKLYGERFRGLYVFGSYAKPDAGIELPEDSDLDVALLLSDFESPYKELDRYGDMVSDLSLEHGLVISLVPIRESDYKEGRTNFSRVISEYAIPVE